MIRLIISIIFLGGLGDLCGQFVFNGSARRIDTTGCYQLTGTDNFESGSIWHTDKIDLTQSFQVVAQVFLGCLDENGADGLVFGFQPVSTSIGQAGEGIGFQGVVPSIGLELDTYQNFNLEDPSFDHIALIANGNLDHRQSLVPPVALAPDSANVEDCRYHHLQVNWDAERFNLKVYFDCRLVIDFTQDLVRTIFIQPEVFWGFTAATGGSVNIHGICLNYTTFLNDVPDYVICPGEQVQLNVAAEGPFHWTPTTGFTGSGLDQVILPDSDIVYRLIFEGPCDTFVIDTVQIDVLDAAPPLPWPDSVILCPDSVITLGYAFTDATYRWSTGDTSVFISVSSPGSYGLTLTRRDTVCELSATIAVIEALDIGPDLLLDTVLCAGEVLVVDVSSVAVSEYIWQDGFSGPQRTFATSGLYELTVTDGCTERRVRISTEIDDCGLIYFPNVFSPNQDGVNDLFEISSEENLVLTSLSIFDRWGDLVYEFQDGPLSAAAWDGTVRGSGAAPPGVYVYRAVIEISAGINKIFSGDLTLIR